MQGVIVSSEPLSRIDPFLLTCRVMYLHTHVNTHKEESEVKAQSQAPVCCNALTEGIQLEL